MTRRTQTEWQSLIQQFEQSGMTQVAFCQQQQLNPKYFSLRRAKLRAANVLPASRFVEAAPIRLNDPTVMTLQYGTVSLQIPTQSIQTVAQLVKALAS